jgi:hypothetical protein
VGTKKENRQILINGMIEIGLDKRNEIQMRETEKKRERETIGRK